MKSRPDPSATVAEMDCGLAKLRAAWDASPADWSATSALVDGLIQRGLVIHALELAQIAAARAHHAPRF